MSKRGAFIRSDATRKLSRITDLIYILSTYTQQHRETVFSQWWKQFENRTSAFSNNVKCKHFISFSVVKRKILSGKVWYCNKVLKIQKCWDNMNSWRKWPTQYGLFLRERMVGSEVSSTTIGRDTTHIDLVIYHHQSR